MRYLPGVLRRFGERFIENRSVDGPIPLIVAEAVRVLKRRLGEAGMEPPTFLDDISSFTVEIPNHALLDEEALAWLAALPLPQCPDLR